MRNEILISFLATAIFINSSWAIPTEYSAVYNAKLKQADGVLSTQLKKNGENYSFELINEEKKL